MKQRALSLEQRLLSSMNEVEERERETLSRLARAIEYRDIGTSAYLERMAHVAGLIAEGLGLSEDEARVIEMAAPLHDMGKIAIPDAILLKPGPLTEEEIAVMRRHPRIGHELLSGSQNRFIQAGAMVALRHHERYDGSGYPDGLVGEAIPLEARIVAVADVFDALISPRPYKEAWSDRSGAGLPVRAARPPVRSRVRRRAGAQPRAPGRHLPALSTVIGAARRWNDAMIVSARRTAGSALGQPARTASTARRWCAWRACRWCWSTCWCAARVREPWTRSIATSC